MRVSRKSALLLLACGSVSLASNAFAISTFLSVGNNTSASGSSLTVNAADIFVIDFEADKSYSCEAIPTDIDSNFDFDTTLDGTTGTTPPTISARSTGNMTPAITGESGDAGNNRLSFITATADRYQITVTNAKVGGEVVRVRCLETTLYGGYNTNVNDFNFLELTNTSDDSISGTITATNFDGEVVIDEDDFTVAANSRSDIDIHTAAGTDKFGIIKVVHNGPFGSLQGVVSQYSGSVSDFDLSTSTPLTPREQVQ